MSAKDRELDLECLRNLIDEARAVITMADIPEDRTKRATELLAVALALSEELLTPKVSAVSWGPRRVAKPAEKPADAQKIAAQSETKTTTRKTSAKSNAK